MITSKDVTKAIHRILKKKLQEQGFSDHTSRSFWRHSESKTDVITFQSYSDYMAYGLHCTTMSFSLLLGCKLKCIPDRSEIPLKDGKKRPEPYACDFFRTMKRGYFQWKPLRRDIWMILPDGTNIDRAVTDAGYQLEKNGYSWFDQFLDLGNLVRVLQAKPYSTDSLGGISNKHSLIRNYLIGCIAKETGDNILATEHLTAAMAMPGGHTLQFPELPFEGLKPKDHEPIVPPNTHSPSA